MQLSYNLFYLTSLILAVQCDIDIKDFSCDNILSLTWLWNLRNNNRCLTVISSMFIPKCFFDQVFRSKFVIRTYIPGKLLNRNIFNGTRSNCDNFMIFSDDVGYVAALFQQKDLTEKRFLPFSQIFLVIPDAVEFEQSAIEYVNVNGLNVFRMENTLTDMENGLISFKCITNVLTKNRLNLSMVGRPDVIKYYGNYKDHPFLNIKNRDKLFRVSLFNCPPYVVYLPGNNKYDS